MLGDGEPIFRSKEPIKEPIKEIKFNNSLDIQVVNDNGGFFPETPKMKENIIPTHPFRSQFLGQTSSGKSNLLVNLLKKPDFYKDYFDEIYLISLTGHADQTFEVLNLPENHIIDKDLEEWAEKAVYDWTEESKRMGVTNIPRRLVIFEDLTANKDLIKSDAFIVFFVQSRHFNCSIMTSIHRLKAVPPTIRDNTSNWYIFEPSENTIDILVKDILPLGWTRQGFKKAITYAFKMKSKNKRPFIQMWFQYKSTRGKVRLNLDQVLNPDYFNNNDLDIGEVIKNQ